MPEACDAREEQEDARQSGRHPMDSHTENKILLSFVLFFLIYFPASPQSGVSLHADAPLVTMCVSVQACVGACVRIRSPGSSIIGLRTSLIAGHHRSASNP